MLGHTADDGLAYGLIPSSERRPWSKRLSPVLGTLLAIGTAIGIFAAVVRSHGAAQYDALTVLARREQAESGWQPPDPKKRCDWVNKLQTRGDENVPHDDLVTKYKSQSKDANVFYRATALLFWEDFVRNGWGNYGLGSLGIEATLSDGSPIERTATWCWVTGDQHLSNFGAWQNRQGELVYTVNDFDEAVIYDFQIDVWRVAVSIYNHALSNGLGEDKADAAVLTFTNAYLSTIESYVGNEDALLFELTPSTATGKLADFLGATTDENSHHAMIGKFTEVTDGAKERRFVRGKKTKLADVPEELERAIRTAFGARGYGATLMKVGWHATKWDDAFFRVVDVAERLGSGIGSFGVGRYYVLLAGYDDDLTAQADGALDTSIDGGIILDVKFEPLPAYASVASGDELAWYADLYANEAARSTVAQRALTSYTDPYAGYITVGGKAYTVRQRSPWKVGLDMKVLTSYAEFAEYVQQIAVSTATSHARGTVGKSPGAFKEVVAAAFKQPYARATWGVSVAAVAAKYREQVLLDFGCFKAFVDANFSKPTASGVRQ